MRATRDIFHIGQKFQVTVKEPNQKKPEGRTVSVQIEKLYLHFALCRVNGRHWECFDYQTLAGSEEMEERIRGNGS